MGVPMIEFRRIQFDEKSLDKYIELLTLCFPKALAFTREYLQWLYIKNPAGLAVGFDAWDGNKLVAHYVCIPCEVTLADKVGARALLSLNSTTHPDYQGKGLFTRIAKLTFASVSQEGFQCVYGVANANSTKAFVHKLGFQLVEPLNAYIGMGGIQADWSAAVLKTQFARKWVAESLAWRVANPRNPITTDCSDGVSIFRAPAMAYIDAYAEVKLSIASTTYQSRGSRLTSALRIYLGLMPTGTVRYPGYFNLPMRFRPSPLNFIYLGLEAGPHSLKPGSLQFTFLDFDAY